MKQVPEDIQATIGDLITDYPLDFWFPDYYPIISIEQKIIGVMSRDNVTGNYDYDPIRDCFVDNIVNK